MIPFRPRIELGRSIHRLGQIGGITSDLARTVIAEAEPAVRRVIQEERNKFADALMTFVPYGAAAAIAYVVTYYMLPTGLGIAKTLGYSASAATAAIGAWHAGAQLEEPVEKKPEPVEGPAWLDPIAKSAAEAIVKEAEPPLRQIVDDERARLATALQHGLPFWIASAASLLATFFMVDEDNEMMKVVGYSGSALLGGAGMWVALEKEKEVAA